MHLLRIRFSVNSYICLDGRSQRGGGGAALCWTPESSCTNLQQQTPEFQVSFYCMLSPYKCGSAARLMRICTFYVIFTVLHLQPVSQKCCFPEPVAGTGQYWTGSFSLPLPIVILICRPTVASIRIVRSRASCCDPHPPLRPRLGHLLPPDSLLLPRRTVNLAARPWSPAPELACPPPLPGQRPMWSTTGWLSFF